MGTLMDLMRDSGIGVVLTVHGTWEPHPAARWEDAFLSTLVRPGGDQPR
ncbi:hypothetical protein [Streptomyces swartbergensis]|nr:hypothetical protein [Streptomyces swartbergensis]